MYLAGVYISPEDQIERELKGGGHSVWGFVIYRTTYTPGREQEFADYMSDLKKLHDGSVRVPGDPEQEIYKHLAWTVFEDKDKLNNATKDTVRGLFDEWCKSDAPAAEQPSAKSPPGESLYARYNYCLVVDDAALDSRLKYGLEIGGRGNDNVSFVNVVQRHYDEDDEYEDDEDEDEDEDIDHGDVYNEEGEDDGLSDIEGNSNEDVGWARVQMAALYTGVYVDLCDPNAWLSYFYTRPPQISH